jgi:bifunctional non-homologous end joining protein LigD
LRPGRVSAQGHLDRLGLRAFAKVSGSKGLQVYVPLNSSTGYDITQPFARTVAELLAAEHPDLVISEMAKAARKGKVFIDWSQNSDFKTTVGVYSLRAKHARPYVSLPVTWDELDAAQKKRDEARLYFEPEAALARLERTGDLFAQVLTLEQKLPAQVVAGAGAGGHAVKPARKALKPPPAPPRRSHQGG